MKRLLLFLFALTSAFAARGGDRFVVAPLHQDQDALKQSALTLMQDVVPHAPVSDEPMRVVGGRSRAIFGKIFGDTQIGALVAAKSDTSKPDDDANLCLLIWQNGWKFAQWAGKVPKSEDSNTAEPPDPLNWNWALKQRAPGEPYYVICGLDVNALSSQEHPSWLCDPKTHSLQPTGWPKDAIPSLSGRTITFERREKSGGAPFLFEIDEFDGKPEKNLATYTGGEPFTVSIPDPATGKRITWRIAPVSPAAKYEPGHDRRSLGYLTADGNLGPFRGDAIVDLLWGTDPPWNGTQIFLIWRLTGIERNAQMGIWDEDMASETEDWLKWANQKPARTVVTGIPEAVKAFSWPLNPAPPVPAAPATNK